MVPHNPKVCRENHAQLVRHSRAEQQLQMLRLCTKHREDPAPRHVSTYSYDSGLFLICCEEMLLSVGLSAGRPATPVQLTDPGFR